MSFKFPDTSFTCFILLLHLSHLVSCGFQAVLRDDLVLPQRLLRQWALASHLHPLSDRAVLKQVSINGRRWLFDRFHGDWTGQRLDVLVLCKLVLSMSILCGTFLLLNTVLALLCCSLICNTRSTAPCIASLVCVVNLGSHEDTDIDKAGYYTCCGVVRRHF